MQLLYRDETLRGENGSKRTKLGQTMLKIIASVEY